jgi:SecD/SecF fusion protein
VLVFMVLSYGLFGVFASVALILNVGLIFGVLSLIGATLTLPGIAGIVLTIGMAVDANVLVFERIREELKTAKGPARAIELGYERALSAIIDANLTTFIIAVILFVLGSGPVRGFSVTLGIGIVTSVFTAIYVTRLLIVTWFDRAPRRRSRSEMRAETGSRRDEHRLLQVRARRSDLRRVGGGDGPVHRHLAGDGAEFRHRFPRRHDDPDRGVQPVDVGAYRDALAPLGLGDVSITEVFDPTFDADQNVAMIRIQAQEGQESVTPETIARGAGRAAGRCIRR